jgi:hypothetical protein
MNLVQPSAKSSEYPPTCSPLLFSHQVVIDNENNFLVSAQLDVEAATLLNKEMEDALRKMFTHFGDDPKKVEDPKAIEDFLKLFVGFTQQFEVSCKGYKLG